MATIASLAVDVIANTGKFVSDLGKAAQGVEGFRKKSERSFGKLQRSIKRFSNQAKRELGGLKGAFAALGLGVATKEVLRLNNTYTAMSNKLKLVTSGAKQLVSVQKDIFEVSQRTRGSLEATTDLYFRMAKSTEQLGMSQSELVDITETVNNAVAVSGSTAASSAAALFQFGQGLAADALRGQELNSIMEQTPRLAQAIADGLGIEIGALRDVAKEGKLTASVVIEALRSQSAVLQEEFGQTEKTVSQAFQQIQNVALETFGTIDAKELIDALDKLKETLQDPAVITGLQSIGAGLVNMVTLVAEGAKSFAEFGKALGFMAAKMAGAFDDPKERMAELVTEMGAVNNKIIEAAQNNRPYQSLLTDLTTLRDEYNKLKSTIIDTSNIVSNTPITATTGAPDLTKGLVSPEETFEYQNAVALNDALKILYSQRTEAEQVEIDQRAAYQAQANQMMLSSSETLYSALSGLIAATGNESKGIQLAMLAFEKSLAITRTIINTEAAAIASLVVDPYGVLATRIKVMGGIATGLIAATGAVQAGAIAGQAHDGMDYIPREGTYNLQKGEMVLDPGTSEQVRNNALGGGGNTYNITLQAIDTQSGIDFLSKHRAEIHNLNSQEMYENNQSFA